MMKKLILVLVLLAVLSVSPAAYALTVNNWLINISAISREESLYDMGTVYSNQDDTWVPLNNVDAQSLANGIASSPDDVEDSFGIFRVNYIKDTTSNTFIFDGEASSNEIVGFFYGLDDVMLDGATNDADVYSTGGYMSLWLNNGDFVASALQGTSGRDDVDSYLGITTGTPLLFATGHERFESDGDDETFAYTYKSNFNFAEPFGGSGDIYWDINPSAGGAWAELLNTDGYQIGDEDFADIYINFSSQPTQTSDWLVQGNGYGNAKAVVPEPASMILMGLGLLGARLRRRKA